MTARIAAILATLREWLSPEALHDCWEESDGDLLGKLLADQKATWDERHGEEP